MMEKTKMSLVKIIDIETGEEETRDLPPKVDQLKTNVLYRMQAQGYLIKTPELRVFNIHLV